MGLSVFSQCDTRKYFSISTIKKSQMEKYGINMSVENLKNLARKSLPYAEIHTGQSKAIGFRRITKIYRYEDFVEVGHGINKANG